MFQREAPCLKHACETLQQSQESVLEPPVLVHPHHAALRTGAWALYPTKNMGHFPTQTQRVWEQVWEDLFHLQESSKVRFLGQVASGRSSEQVSSKEKANNVLTWGCFLYMNSTRASGTCPAHQPPWHSTDLSSLFAVTPDPLLA